MTHTVGYKRVKIFDTTGCRNPSRSYSQQYQHTSDDPDEVVRELQTATEGLDEPIDELTEQITELSERMGEVADGMAAFDQSRRQLARVSAGAHTNAGPRDAGD